MLPSHSQIIFNIPTWKEVLMYWENPEGNEGIKSDSEFITGRTGSSEKHWKGKLRM
jgi:hypothetical protein